MSKSLLLMRTFREVDERIARIRREQGPEAAAKEQREHTESIVWAWKMTFRTASIVAKLHGIFH